MRVAIVTGGFFALFSSKNGAVETLAEQSVDRIVFDNSPTLLMALRVKGNWQSCANKWMHHMHNIVPSIFRCYLDMMVAAICGVLSGGLRLGVNEAESRDGASFCGDCVSLANE